MLEQVLQISLLTLDRIATGFDRHFNRRTDHKHNTGEGPGKLKKIPGFVEDTRVFGENVKPNDRATAAASQNYGPWFCKVTRSPRTVGRKGHVTALLEPLRQHGEASQAAAGRTPECGVKT